MYASVRVTQFNGLTYLAGQVIDIYQPGKNFRTHQKNKDTQSKEKVPEGDTEHA